jgi:murein DD-endopeptidase MepM/ murein hydrolase activator NlpD
MRVSRRRVLFAIPAVLGAGYLPLLAGCSAAADDNVKVRVVTPAGGANPGGPPGATSTPFATPEILLSTSNVYEAGAVLVSVTGPVTSGALNFLKRPYTLTKGAQSMYAFVGVDADDPPGKYPLTVSYVLPNGSKGALADEEITILKTNWTVDSVIVGASLSALLDPAVGDAETNQLKTIYSQYTPEKYWKVGWIQPVEGTITTRFGEQRSYNGSPPAGHHGGTDIGADFGVPVTATNNGRVVMARQLRLRGNMVVIDHGGGLFSGYAHMSSFAAAEGQMVSQGDVIGYVGSTGLSTGSHLHWEIAANGISLDALRFLDGSNGF